jgi:hypothetical protein
MPSYLERYRQEEREQVWAELLALGGQVRKPGLYDEAWAVARETMTRARANIEALVLRLASLGYQFAHADRVFVPADEETRRLPAEVERRAGPLPLSLRAWCEVVGEVNFMGSHPKLSTYVQSFNPRELAQGFLSLVAKHGGPVVPTGDPLRQGAALSQRLLDDVVQRIKTGQPRSPEQEAGARACREFLGMFQPSSVVVGPEVESDPLVVEPYFGDLEDTLAEGADGSDGAEEEGEGSGEYGVVIAPDATHKTNHSGGSPYCIRFPDPAADAPLEGDEDYGTFVEYLRLCFRWGGFPGLRAATKPPREELAYLTQGLLPL